MVSLVLPTALVAVTTTVWLPSVVKVVVKVPLVSVCCTPSRCQVKLLVLLVAV